MDNKTRVCKICNRHFANGKAMGGHMRSHLAKLPLPPKPNRPPPPPSSSPPSSTSSLNYPPITSEGTSMQQPYRSLKHEVTPPPHHRLVTSPPKPSADLLYGESSEAEYSRNSIRKRSRWCRESVMEASLSPEQVSTISDVFTEGDVARCLLMLSRDKWKTKIEDVQRDVYESGDDDMEEEQEEEEEEEEDQSFNMTHTRSKVRWGKYRCLSCNKGFRSYQALGGHRANHKRIRAKKDESEGEGCGGSGGGIAGSSVGVLEQKTFKCPFCDKVFESGQALGGHKKVHFPYLGDNSNHNSNNNTKIRDTNILLDLNLPAPEDDGEVSQV